MNYADNLDDEDRAWLDTFECEDAAILEGYIAVVVWLDSQGVRRWTPAVSLEAPTDTIAGLWALGGHAVMTTLLEDTAISGDIDD